MQDIISTSIKDVEELIRFVESGKPVSYLFFWGHQPTKDGSISKSCMSNWYRSPFVSDGITYPTTEHYMMAKKALLFGDEPIYRAILQAKTPQEAKALGRKVKNFVEEVWNMHRKEIVIAGNEAKFSQQVDLKHYLLSTQDNVLIEASPYDRIWGIGMAMGEKAIENPRSWKGLNLLGFALMEVRNRIAMAKDALSRYPCLPQ
ncbi:MAG: NADAR family protein [Chloroflexota bacterium]